jgi:hypothetical protein
MSSGRKRLVLEAAWRVETPRLWRQYASQLDAVASEVKRLQKSKNGLPWKRCTTDLEPKLAQFCGSATESLQGAVNEVFLLHGTKPETLQTILAKKIRRVSSAMESILLRRQQRATCTRRSILD